MNRLLFVLYVFSALPALPAVALTATITNDLFEAFVNKIFLHQTAICDLIHEHETTHFTKDLWSKGDGKSTGVTRVISDGALIEKGAVSISVIRDQTLSAERAIAMGRRIGTSFAPGSTYSAAALSLVLHSRHPLVPTFRSDVRVFKVGELCFFGGGADLTPYYLDDKDITAFHEMYKALCERHGEDYATHKASCDSYFYLPARGEHRGTGGIYFEDMPATPETLGFVNDLCGTLMKSWFEPICLKRRNDAYTEGQRDWQLIRRGRYLEFNLLYDRGESVRGARGQLLYRF